MSVIEEAKKILAKLEKMKEPDGSIIIEQDGVKYRFFSTKPSNNKKNIHRKGDKEDIINRK